MVSIRKLEIESEKTIQTILLDFMSGLDYSDFDDSFDAEMYYFNHIAEPPMKENVTKVYKEGYGNANTLMKRSAPVGLLKLIPPTKTVKDEVVPVKEFDIRTITNKLMNKLKLLTYHQKREIAERLALHFEEQYTYDQIVDDMSKYFKYDTNVTSRFARTATNHVYNRSHLHRYRDIGIVPGTQYGAHIDNRTSEICIMLNGTIWAINDPNIKVPPSHFNCYGGHTVIKTLDGDKYIKDVTTHDFVLTHKSRFKRVTDTMSRYSDELLEIKTHNRTIKVTPNHPILVNKSGIVLWVNVGDLTTNDKIVIVERRLGGRNMETEQIKSIHVIPNQMVYNLSVLDDESYVANCIISHNCRSRLKPYFGGIPGERDYKKDFDPEFIKVAEETLKTFHTKYWDI